MWAYVVMFLELVGGICLIIGLFTRFVAAALAIEMLVALLFVHLPKGYAAGGGGYEYVLLIEGQYASSSRSAAAVLIRLTAPLARSFRGVNPRARRRGDRIELSLLRCICRFLGTSRHFVAMRNLVATGAYGHRPSPPFELDL